MDRAGYVRQLIVGDAHQIFLPDLKRQRIGRGRLRGLRLVHSHLKKEPLTEDDITDLVLLRLDMVSAITFGSRGLPENMYSAHINPDPASPEDCVLLDPVHPAHCPEDFLFQVEGLEAQLSRHKNQTSQVRGEGRAILVALATPGTGPEQVSRSLNDSLAELSELCATAGIEVVDTLAQTRKRPDPRFVIGRGKLKEIVFRSIRYDCELLIFDRELSPAQAKALSDFSDLKIIDRTQLILDIFARNASSRDGKIQVELAQLRYLKSRLSEMDDNMSRLTGGIGGRGPGETKLEIGRRRVTDRIALLEKQLKSMRDRRGLNRRQRQKALLPAAAIIGYTNAGKSTLLNRLTNSETIAENKLFATLDPTTRRVRFPEEMEIILADTVGFIHDLPEELINAFKATLEELYNADLLIHLVDASSPARDTHIAAVEKILRDLELADRERMVVFNKADQLSAEEQSVLNNRYPEAVLVSAVTGSGLEELLRDMEHRLRPRFYALTDQR